jgi:hypothetical protein
MCPQSAERYRFYALKRFARNADNEVTAQALHLSEAQLRTSVRAGKAGAVNRSSFACVRAAAARRRLP